MADFQKTKAIYEDGKIILTFKIHYCRDELGQRTNRGNLSPQTVQRAVFIFKIKTKCNPNT